MQLLNQYKNKKVKIEYDGKMSFGIIDNVDDSFVYIIDDRGHRRSINIHKITEIVEQYKDYK
jgi:hypothetical protein